MRTIKDNNNNTIGMTSTPKPTPPCPAELAKRRADRILAGNQHDKRKHGYGNASMTFDNRDY